MGQGEYLERVADRILATCCQGLGRLISRFSGPHEFHLFLVLCWTDRSGNCLTRARAARSVLRTLFICAVQRSFIETVRSANKVPGGRTSRAAWFNAYETGSCQISCSSSSLYLVLPDYKASDDRDQGKTSRQHGTLGAEGLHEWRSSIVLVRDRQKAYSRPDTGRRWDVAVQSSAHFSIRCNELLFLAESSRNLLVSRYLATLESAQGTARPMPWIVCSCLMQ